jgi:hypothetical protein
MVMTMGPDRRGDRESELSGPQHRALLVLHLEDAVERQVTDLPGEPGEGINDDRLRVCTGRFPGA